MVLDDNWDWDKRKEKGKMTFYIIFFIVIVILCTIGALTELKESSEKKAKTNRALVISCEECEGRGLNTTIQCYDVCFEIESPNGVIRKTVKTSKYYKPGLECKVHYDEESVSIAEEIELKKDRNNAIIGLFVILGLVVMFCAFLADDYFGEDISFVVVLAFLLIGFSAFIISFIVKCIRHNKKQNDLDVYRVPGRVVELARRSGGSRVPVFEFYDEGVRRTIEASVGDGYRSLIRRRVGDEVVIVIDRKTKEAYCEEDRKRGQYANMFMIGVFIFVVGCVIWALLQR